MSWGSPGKHSKFYISNPLDSEVNQTLEWRLYCQREKEARAVLPKLVPVDPKNDTLQGLVFPGSKEYVPAEDVKVPAEKMMRQFLVAKMQGQAPPPLTPMAAPPRPGLSRSSRRGGTAASVKGSARNMLSPLAGRPETTAAALAGGPGTPMPKPRQLGRAMSSRSVQLSPMKGLRRTSTTGSVLRSARDEAKIPAGDAQRSRKPSATDVRKRWQNHQRTSKELGKIKVHVARRQLAMAQQNRTLKRLTTDLAAILEAKGKTDLSSSLRATLTKKPLGPIARK